MPRRQILLDACVVINLAAVTSLEEIANALHATFLVVQQAATEVGHLRDLLDGELVLTPIDLGQFSLGEALRMGLPGTSARPEQTPLSRASELCDDS
jgi:hypothetical protein